MHGVGSLAAWYWPLFVGERVVGAQRADRGNLEAHDLPTLFQNFLQHIEQLWKFYSRRDFLRKRFQRGLHCKLCDEELFDRYRKQ